MKMTKKMIEANCAKIAADSVTLDALIQDTGLAVLDHIEAHGDVTLANRLYNSLGRGHRKSALTVWYLAHGKVLANTDAKTKKEMPFVYDKTKVTDLVGAAEKPWFDCKPDAEPDAVFYLHAKLAAMLRSAEKADKVDGIEFLADLRVIVEAMAKAKANPVTVLADHDPLAD